MNTLQNSTSLETQYKSVESGAVQKPAVSVKSAGEVSAAATVSAASSNAQVVASAKSQAVTPDLKQAAANKTHVSPEKVPNQSELDTLNKKLADLNNYMQFKRDKVSGRDVFSLVDSTTEKVIKQYPSEEFLNVSRRLTEYLDQIQNAHNGQQETGNVGNIISEAV